MDFASKVPRQKTRSSPIVLNQTLEEHRAHICIALEAQLMEAFDLLEATNFDLLEGINFHLSYDPEAARYVLVINDPQSLFEEAHLIPDSYETFRHTAPRHCVDAPTDHVFYASRIDDMITAINSVINKDHQIEVPACNERIWLN